MSHKGRILIVEDDSAIATGLEINLRLEGYDPAIAADGVEALASIRRYPPALILLDIGMPRKDGLAVLSELRSSADHTPVIVLSAREGEYDKVAALRLGADDYVTKPFALAELMARVDAVLRRAGSSRGARSTPGRAEEICRFGDVVIDPSTRTVTRGSDPIKLTHLEFELLQHFVANPSKVMTRRDLLRDVWGLRSSGSQRTVDNFVAQLRAKLERDPDRPRHFVTVRGSGYRFDP
jgi:DNA-binding response OmpR family regulator